MAYERPQYGWAYAPPSHLEGEPAVPIPDSPPGTDIPLDTPTRLPTGVIAYRQSQDAYERMLDEQRRAKEAQMAAEQSMLDAQMFAQMARVSKSTSDIINAKRSIDMMGLQRDIQAGVPIHEAVARRPLALGSGFAGALRATAPEPTVPAPSVVNLPGMPPAVRSGRYGEQVQFAPASTIQAPLDTQGVVLKDPDSGKRIGMAYRTGPHSQRIVLDEVLGNADPRLKNSIYGSQERALMQQLEDTTMKAALLNPKSPQHAYAKELKEQLMEVRRKRAALIEAPSAVSTNGTTRRAVRNPKTGKWELK